MSKYDDPADPTTCTFGLPAGTPCAACRRRIAAASENPVMRAWHEMSGAFFDAADRARANTAPEVVPVAAPIVIDEDTADVARPAWLPPVKRGDA